MKHVYLYVCGILTQPGNADNWTGRAVTWTMARGLAYAEKIEYWATPFDRTLGQVDRAKKMARCMSQYASRGFQISIAAHSNGADVTLDALRISPIPIESLHLIAPACSADCAQSGINEINTKEVTVHIGGNDRALELADTGFGKLLGFGSLGRTGPTNQTRVVNVFRYPEFGHETWFDRERFDATMERLTEHL